jgi:hypothetical protein
MPEFEHEARVQIKCLSAGFPVNGELNASTFRIKRLFSGRQTMLSTLARQGYRLGFLVALIAALAVFVPAGFTQDQQNPPDASQDQNRIDTTADKNLDQTPSDSDLQKPSDSKLTDNQVEATAKLDLDHLQNYVGQRVTIHGEFDHIYSDMAYDMEGKQDKDKEHFLVINLMPESVQPDGGAVTDKPVAVTGTIRMFDHAELMQDYPFINLGSASLKKFEGQAVLVMGERELEASLMPKTTETDIAVAQIEREKPSVTEPEAVAPVEPVPAPEPEPAPAITQPEPTPAPAPEQNTQTTRSETTTTENKLPRTASPLVALGLSGLLSLATGLGIRLRRS